MKLISRVTNKDVGHIIFTLAEARKRPQSEHFLEGFPWLSITWYKVEKLQVSEFENLYLLWDGGGMGSARCTAAATQTRDKRFCRPGG